MPVQEAAALPRMLDGARERRPAHPHPAARWRTIAVDVERRMITRPPGVGLDSGGIAKGLAADALAHHLRERAGFAVDCAGDLRIGGSAGVARRVGVEDPFGGEMLREFLISDGGIATSGIGRRSWHTPNGYAHHLLDPTTGAPCYTGVVQATALAPTALEAEVLAKAALLSGPDDAPGWLDHGGLLVLEDGSRQLVEPRIATVVA